MYNIAAVLHCGTVPQMFSNARDALELRGYPGAPGLIAEQMFLSCPWYGPAVQDRCPANLLI
jgi:hypothetical protein